MTNSTTVSSKPRMDNFRTPKSSDVMSSSKFPPASSHSAVNQGSGGNHQHEVLKNKQDGTFANLLLPSIPATNQRSSKQIKNMTEKQIKDGSDMI